MDTPTDEHDLHTPATDRKNCATSALFTLSDVPFLQRRPAAAADGTPEESLKAADRNLYQAKRNGRDCVVLSVHGAPVEAVT